MATPVLPALPGKNEWVQWEPSVKGQGRARLSQAASNYVLDMLTWAQTVAGLRSTEHQCLDEHEKKGLIRQ